MFKSLVLGFMAIALPAVSLAADVTPNFAVKIYQNDDVITAVVKYGRVDGLHASCQLHYLNSGADALTRVYDCNGVGETIHSSTPVVRFIATKSPTAQYFEGFISYSGPGGFTQSIVGCSNDSRGFIGCVEVDRN